jgi:formylglycine-generating enzyme required for sulfatase activity
LLSDFNQGDIPIIRAFLKICIITSAMLAALFALVLPALAEQFAAIEIDAKHNTLDGCIDCGCHTKGQIELGTKKQWWVSFGQVEPDGQEGWKAVASSSHCGAGTFRNVSSAFKRTIGIPYALLEFSTAIVSLPEGAVHLETNLKFSKLSGFDTNGEHVYVNSIQKRTFSLADNANQTLPLLISSKREKEAFGVHEVLVRLNVSMLGHGPVASYGMISVSADVPGAKVFLDGGFAGLITEGNPLLLKNVLTGTRGILVRDFSGREAYREVIVEKNENAAVSLKVLNNMPTRELNSLVPVGKNLQGYEEYWRVKDSALVVMIPAGEFLMGSNENEGEAPERPQQVVHLSGFFIDKTEVTWRQFRKYVEAKGGGIPLTPIWGTPDDYPASFILWEEAKGYCAWVGGRLPTEAEWEKAARGEDGRKYPWGNEWDQERCNSISGGPHRPESVGSFPECVSPYGVLDMSGSIWEWCADWYGERYYSESSSLDPQGPASGTRRIIRGGAWMSQPLWLRTAYRFSVPPTTRKADHGFRCAQEAPE